MFKAHRKTVHNNAHTHARTHTLHASMQAPMQVLLHGRSTLSHTRIRHTHPSTCTPHTHFPPPATRQRARARQCTEQCEASLSKKKRLCPSRRRVPEAKAPRCPSVLCISSPSDSFLQRSSLFLSTPVCDTRVSQHSPARQTAYRRQWKSFPPHPAPAAPPHSPSTSPPVCIR